MSLYKRKTNWWVRFTAPNGTRVRCSANTDDKTLAQEFHDNLKAKYWKVYKLKEKPTRSWQHAVIRWLDETQHKASREKDLYHLRYLDQYLRNYALNDINRDHIDLITKSRMSEDVSPATVNRMLAVLRAVLRKAEREWEWIDKAPYIRMLKEPKRRIRWLTKEEAKLLLSILPEHLASMACFSLSTGLRQSNVSGLQWSQVDLQRRHAWIHADEAKRNISVPLNDDAVCVIKDQIGRHDQYIFTYRGNPIKQVNTKVWRKALIKANIHDFRWHDLRHTWANWHVQQGTPLAVV